MLHAKYQTTTNKREYCEFLKRSQAVAKECADEYAIVTYNLAVAKITNSDLNSPKVDDCFIQFG